MKAKNIFRTTVATLLALTLSLQTAFAQTVPADVENLKAEGGDAKVTLTWDPATGPAKITKYMVFQGTKSVTAEGGRYEKNYDAGNVTTYDVTGLTNGTKYHFAIVAFDENGEHSENYSNEVSATPQAAGQDTSAPKVSAATALNSTEITVTFSKSVTLPAANPEKAFTIKENISDAKLEVTDAKVSAADDKIVILTTNKQAAGKEYILTAHSDITDKDKNPIKSGTSDTASFTGSSVEKSAATPTPTPDASPTASPSPSPVADTAPPTIKEIKVEANNKIEIIFSEDIALKDGDLISHFKITEKDNELKEIEVTGVEYSGDKPASVILETAVQDSKKEYVVTVTQVKDLAGNTISELLNGNKANYTSKEMQLTDVIPPEDVTNLVAKVVGDAVKLTWKASVNTAKDLVDQIVYQSTNDGKTFTKIKNLGPAVTNYTIKNLTAGMKYTFKLTVKDANGNESKGKITTVTLPETGAGLGLSLAGTMIGLAAFHRRRKRKI